MTFVICLVVFFSLLKPSCRELRMLWVSACAARVCVTVSVHTLYRVWTRPTGL